VARSTRIAFFVGGLAGTVIGLATIALAAGRVMSSGVGIDGAGAPSFVVGQAGMYVLVVAAGAIGGAITGALGFAVAREVDPDTRRFGAGWMTVLAAGTGAVVGFGVFRAIAGAAGDVVEGVVTLSVFRAVVTALVTGALTGAVTAGAVDRLSRAEAYGFSGEAWPSSVGHFIRETAAAIGLPLAGVAGGVGVIYVFARLLLASDTNVALVLFGGVGAVILFGAAIAAALGSRRSH
jgi:hypothetical protein